MAHRWRQQTAMSPPQNQLARCRQIPGKCSKHTSMCSQVEEADYDARLTAYAQLLPGAWAALPPWQAAPLAHAALADLRNPDDIALRHAAAQVRLLQ